MMTFVDGVYGVLQSEGWAGETIMFTGRVTMLGIDCELRQTIERRTLDEFYVRNDEHLSDGNWNIVDDFDFHRR